MHGREKQCRKSNDVVMKVSLAVRNVTIKIIIEISQCVRWATVRIYHGRLCLFYMLNLIAILAMTEILMMVG